MKKEEGCGNNGKKHPCEDCSFCQWCSDDRCRMCRSKQCGKKKKLSSAEQIDLYESLNRKKST